MKKVFMQEIILNQLSQRAYFDAKRRGELKEDEAYLVVPDEVVRVPEVMNYLKSKTKYSGADDLTSILKGIIDYCGECGKCDGNTDPVSPPDPISPPEPTADDMTVEPIYSEPGEIDPVEEPNTFINFNVEQEPSDFGQIRLKITASFSWTWVREGFDADLVLDTDGVNLRKKLHFKPNQTGAYVTIKWERDGGFNGRIETISESYSGSQDFNFIVEPSIPDEPY